MNIKGLRWKVLLTAATLAIAVPGLALADTENYNWTFGSSALSGNGTLTWDSLTDLITGGTGTVTVAPSFDIYYGQNDLIGALAFGPGTYTVTFVTPGGNV